MTLRVVWITTAIIAVASARSVREAQSKNFMGEGTDSLAVSLLQSESHTKTNLVFSPLGYTTILAILAEGARESTRNQLTAALKLPEDTYALRSTFKSVLENMQEHMVLNKPEFKNWFYVYKNYSVEESYKAVLKDNYLTEVKEIEHHDMDENESHDSAVAVSFTESKNPLPAVIQPVPGRVDENKESSEEKKTNSSEEENTDSSEEKKTDSSEEKKMGSSEEKMIVKNDKNSSEEKKKIKLEDTSEEVKKKVDKPLTNEEKQAEDENKAMEEIDEDLKPVRHEAENPIKEPETIKKEAEKETVKKTLEKLAMEDIVARSFNGGNKIEKEILTALSANRLSSYDNSTKEGENKTVSRMIIFNALYYRGNWSVPFVVSNEPQTFYLSDTDKIPVDAMSASGEFPVGKFPELGASAIELPYQGERYSLLVVLPNERNGLSDVIAKLSNYSITDISNKLEKHALEVCIPKFSFYTITRPKDALVKCGITDIFNDSADLSGITGTKGLFLDDLVQLVTIEVENSVSSFNWLTTSNVADLASRAEPEKFNVHHPFFFALRDRVENVIVVAGKVLDPRRKEKMSH